MAPVGHSSTACHWPRTHFLTFSECELKTEAGFSYHHATLRNASDGPFTASAAITIVGFTTRQCRQGDCFSLRETPGWTIGIAAVEAHCKFGSCLCSQ